MFYKERIEEDKLKQIMEQNISYLDQISEQMKLGYLSVFAGLDYQLRLAMLIGSVY